MGRLTKLADGWLFLLEPGFMLARDIFGRTFVLDNDTMKPVKYAPKVNYE